MYPDNTWYGHRKILADYCEVRDCEILGSIQHGVHISDYQANLGHHALPMAKYFCWDKKTFDHCKSNNVKNVIPIGSPFIYLDKTLENKEKYLEKGTIAFPSHNTPDENRQFKHDIFIKYVMENYPPPYTVSLFYIDYNNETKKLYNDKGWETVTAGDRSDQNFLKNIYDFIQKHEYCVFTELGSGLFYSMYLYKKSSYKPTYKDGQKEILFSSHTSYSHFQEDQLKSYEKKNKFLFDKIINKDRGKELADFQLGKNFLTDKENLRKILGHDSLFKNLIAFSLKKIINFKHGKFINWK